MPEVHFLSTWQNVLTQQDNDDPPSLEILFKDAVPSKSTPFMVQGRRNFHEICIGLFTFILKLKYNLIRFEWLEVTASL